MLGAGVLCTQVGGLLKVKVSERLGSFKGGAEDILAHEWFRGFDMDALVNRMLRPPWRPSLSGVDDTSCFDIDEESEQAADFERMVREGERSWTPPADAAEAAELEQRWSDVVAAFSS